MNFFNSKGELNAYSTSEAIQQIVRLASVLQEGVPANMAVSAAPQMSDEERDSIVARAIMTQDGKVALAQSMANPIRRNLDYHGIFRRTLVVDPLPQGAIPRYDRDIDVTAIMVSSNGSAQESRVFSESVIVPELEFVSNPLVRMSEVRQRRFNVIERAVQKARQEIMAMEDANGFMALDLAAQVENTLTDITDAGMKKKDLLAIKANIDSWDLVTAKFFMNIRNFTEILMWGSGGGEGTTGGSIDPVTQREILQTGLYGKIWGADILVSKIVPVDTVYGCADPEFVGVMPIRQDIEVIPADEPKRLSLGWIVSENIGIGILNPRAVACGRKNVTVA